MDTQYQRCILQKQRSILSACSRAIEDRTQCGAILFCGVCCAAFIIEDRRFRNTVQESLKECSTIVLSQKACTEFAVASIGGIWRSKSEQNGFFHVKHSRVTGLPPSIKVAKREIN